MPIQMNWVLQKSKWWTNRETFDLRRRQLKHSRRNRDFSTTKLKIDFLRVRLSAGIPYSFAEMTARRRWQIKPQSPANNHKTKIFICYVLHVNLFDSCKRILPRWIRMENDNDRCRHRCCQRWTRPGDIDATRNKIDNLYIRNLHLNRWNNKQWELGKSGRRRTKSPQCRRKVDERNGRISERFYRHRTKRMMWHK